ncbi:MAG: hypothetical protein ACJAU0_000799 [Flavobacteriales bacterium]|jgi:hypothetical protein
MVLHNSEMKKQNYIPFGIGAMCDPERAKMSRSIQGTVWKLGRAIFKK